MTLDENHDYYPRPRSRCRKTRPAAANQPDTNRTHRVGPGPTPRSAEVRRRADVYEGSLSARVRRAVEYGLRNSVQAEVLAQATAAEGWPVGPSAMLSPCCAGPSDNPSSAGWKSSPIEPLAHRTERSRRCEIVAPK